jgi:predicted nucleic acid-binding protein
LEHIFEWVSFEIVDPSREMVIEAARQVALKDAPILAAAKTANIGALVTLDKRHLLDRPELERYISARILRPKEAYEWIVAEGVG